LIARFSNDACLRVEFFALQAPLRIARDGLPSCAQPNERGNVQRDAVLFYQLKKLVKAAPLHLQSHVFCAAPNAFERRSVERRNGTAAVSADFGGNALNYFSVAPRNSEPKLIGMGMNVNEPRRERFSAAIYP
jgi:hypothetical protein